MKNVLLIVVLLVIPIGATVGGYFTYFRKTTATESSVIDRRDDYTKWITEIKADDAQVRAELLELITTTKVALSDADKAKIAKLTFNVDDVQTLLQIEFVGEFVTNASLGKTEVFAFLTPEEQIPLKALLGPKPTPTEVRNFRSHLAALASEFNKLRQKPDWNVEVSGEEKVDLPMLDMLREGYEFLPADQHPVLKLNPTLGVFTRADAEMVLQLDRYFNGPRAKAAFPPSRFSRVYTGNHMATIPMGLIEYAKEIQTAIDAEKKMLLPGEKPPQKAIEAVNDVFANLERFLSVVYGFGR